MFRTMRRFKQELTREECLAVLRSQPRGVLSLLGENGYPYGLPSTTGTMRLTESSTSTVRRKDTRLTPSAPAIRRPSAYTTKDSAWQGSGRCIFAVSSCLGASPR